MITADALRCQREHLTYLAERGARWILTVKGNQLHLHAQLAALPWRAVPDATRDTTSGHGRREIRTLKVLTISTGIDFPHAAQALGTRRSCGTSAPPPRGPPREARSDDRAAGWLSPPPRRSARPRSRRPPLKWSPEEGRPTTPVDP